MVDTRVIYCGDNLEQLKKLPDACVDLIYIDPPFNSNRNYEVFWGETKEKRAFEDRHASTQAYIEFMRPRCVELARVLKKTGSFYYHCDWHASHYVKVMLDQIFGENNFINEIIWKRQSSHNDAKQGSKHYGRLHDVLLFYCGGDEDYTWDHQYAPLDPSYIESHYSQVDEQGRHFQWGDLRAPGGAAPSKGNPHYTVMGVNGYWRFTQEKMEEFIREGRVAIPPGGKVPRYKRYLTESKGLPVGSVWDDINPINSQAKEALGYPTQKPLPLLERIIKLQAIPTTSSSMLSADAARRLWRLKTSDVSGLELTSHPPPAASWQSECATCASCARMRTYWRNGKGFVVRDLPWTEKQLREIPPFEFENWAVIALGGIPNKTQVGDMGIDGRIYPLAGSASQNRQGGG